MIHVYYICVYIIECIFIYLNILLFRVSLQLYVECVVKNPVCVLGLSLDSQLFSSRLDAFIRGLPFYSPRAA